MRSDVIDIDVRVHARTDKGIRVSTSGQQIDAEWLPLSKVEVDMRENGHATISLPEWLALEKGLI